MILTITPTYAEKSIITSIGISNNPVNVDIGKSLIVKYRVLKGSRVTAKILNANKKVIKTIILKKYQKPGIYSLKWNGKDSNGNLTVNGTYSLSIYAKAVSVYSVYSYKTRVKVINTLLFSEYFNRADGLLADNYGTNDPLGKWDVTSQRLYVKNYQGYTDSPVFRAVTIKSDFSNFSLSSDMMKTKLGVDDWDGLNLFFRYKDPDNLYVAGLRNDNFLQLKKKVGGTYYTLAQVSLDSTQLNHWYNLKVIAKGSNIQVFVDGQKNIEVVDTSFTSGKVGIRTDNIDAYFDNYKVYSQ